MTRLQSRLILAFAVVALVSVAAVAAITTAAIRSEFDRYLFGRPIVSPEGQDPAIRSLPGNPMPPSAFPHMRDVQSMRARMRRAMGPPELLFLRQLRRATWLGAMGGGVAAVLLGMLVARYMTAPLRQMSAAAARIGAGDLAQEVPVPSTDELGNMARAFNTMTSDLRRLEESRRQLVADIAHELGTPLAVLQANLEGMLDGVVTASPDRLASLHTQVRLLARLVNDLRDLSLAQAGRLVLNRAPVDLGALASDAAGAVAPYAAERGVTVESRVTSRLPPVIVDRDRLMQVVHNLLDNAIRHTPAGRTVTVRVEPGTGELRLSVADTGPGIPPEEIERIFDRFYRLDPARSRMSGGTGLGLAIVKTLVEAHGGQVLVTSQMGKGSTFTVALPLSP